MLEQLTFDVCLQSPYNLLYDFIHKLGIEENKIIRNTAWAFLNDSQLTIMCLRLKPADIAIASIYFAVSITLFKTLHRNIFKIFWDDFTDVLLRCRPNMVKRRSQTAKMERHGGNC